MSSAPAASFAMVRRTGHPDFLDLPWHLALSEWRNERMVEVPQGISRHVVRFVRYGEARYALKELPQRLAEREYRLLAELDRLLIPVVEVAALVTARRWRGSRSGGSRRPLELEAVLITRLLDFSLPYRRALQAGSELGGSADRLLDALVNLLVRLHVVGFFWGDCSLSNTLFRLDAGDLAAYVVDTETGELHPQLSGGQRTHDLMVAGENLAGELLDLSAEGVEHGLDPLATAEELERRYLLLWAELTQEVSFAPDQRYRVEDGCAGSTPWASPSRRWRCSPRTAPTACGSAREWSTPATTCASCSRSPASRSRRTRRAASSTTWLATVPSWSARAAAASPKLWPPAAGSPRSSRQRWLRCPVSCGEGSTRPSSSTRCSITAGTFPRPLATTSGFPTRWPPSSPPCCPGG